MLRAFYISAIVLTFFSMIISAYFMDEVSSCRSASYYSFGDSYGSDDNFEYYHDKAQEATVSAGIITMIYFLIMETIFILSLIRLKTKTIKVFSIIGISLTSIMILWDALMISSPGGISFDEIGLAWVLFMLIMFAFSIVGTVHAFRKKV